jgi:LPXTG-site transpeptidase (sortase) family protein
MLTLVKLFSRIFPNILVALGLLLIVLSVGPIVRDEIWFRLKEAKLQEYRIGDSTAQQDSVFSRFLSTRPVNIEPVNKDFALVIERIGLNTPVKADVSVTNEVAYKEALKEGVAHALVSDYPSNEPGNTYLFAHASLNFWELGKYATTFNLLRKLDWGDRIHVFYKGEIFVYEVVNKEVMKGWNTYPLLRSVIEPTLTLQTCDPPGTTLNRLVVTANLIDVQP